MNKKELIDRIAEKTTEFAKKDIAKALNLTTETISEVLAEGDDVLLIGFGNFTVKDCKERNGRNPSTGEEMVIAAKKAVRFKAGKGLAEAVN